VSGGADRTGARLALIVDQLADTLSAIEALLNWQARLCVRQEQTLAELDRVVGVIGVLCERLGDPSHPMSVWALVREERER
jgi:hypothetical protein